MVCNERVNIGVFFQVKKLCGGFVQHVLKLKQARLGQILVVAEDFAGLLI